MIKFNNRFFFFRYERDFLLLWKGEARFLNGLDLIIGEESFEFKIRWEECKILKWKYAEVEIVFLK